MQAAMQSIVSYILKSYFDEYVDGLHRIDCSKIPVTLRDLKIKEKKIQEDMDDGAFQFTEGSIGQVELQMSWRGHLEVVASDVRLKFSFHPLKAMKKVLMPEPEDQEDDRENLVPLDVQKRLATSPPPAVPAPVPVVPQPPPGPPVPPRFCTAHDSSEKRRKCDPHSFECQNCNMKIETNYAEAKLCPPCSEKEHRCMCCGNHAPLPGGTPAPAPTPPEQDHRAACTTDGAVQQTGPPPTGPPQTVPPQTAPPQPAFCPRHATSEQRPKTEPQMRSCNCCQVQLQTNYVDFALCPSCSRRETRCMICGGSAEHDSSPSRAPRQGAGHGGHGPTNTMASGRQATADGDFGHDLPPPPPPFDRHGQQASLGPVPPRRSAPQRTHPDPGHMPPAHSMEQDWGHQRPPSPPRRPPAGPLGTAGPGGPWPPSGHERGVHRRESADVRPPSPPRAGGQGHWPTGGH